VKNDRFRWAEARIQRLKRFAELLTDETLRREVFNEKYFEGVERRRDTLLAAERKMHLVHLSGVLVLGLSVLSVHIPVSLFGLSTADSSSLRELALLLLATVRLATLLPTIDLSNLTDQLEAFSGIIAKQDPTVRRALRIRY
jgi:hypothetical protein